MHAWRLLSWFGGFCLLLRLRLRRSAYISVCLSVVCGFVLGGSESLVNFVVEEGF